MTFGPDNVGNMAQCELLGGFIVSVLQAYGDWDAQMRNYLSAQTGFEIGYQIPPDWQIGPQRLLAKASDVSSHPPVSYIL
jgi:hypothetical protein